MRIGEGVEWGLHACTVLAAVPESKVLPARGLAEALGVTAPYLAKHLQALSRAGIVEAVGEGDTVVATTESDGQGGFSLTLAPGAYVVRAVAPGRYAQPAATAEDMYRPDRFARTGAGAVVTKDVPPDTLVVGMPARGIKKLQRKPKKD